MNYDQLWENHPWTRNPSQEDKRQQTKKDLHTLKELKNTLYIQNISKNLDNSGTPEE